MLQHFETILPLLEGKAAPHWTAHTIGCENNRITTQTITLTLNTREYCFRRPLKLGVLVRYWTTQWKAFDLLNKMICICGWWRCGRAVKSPTMAAILDFSRIRNQVNPFVTAGQLAKKPHFPQIYLLWNSLRLISIRLAKNEFCNEKGISFD